MDDENSESFPAWFVKGAVAYTTSDGTQRTGHMILRNIIAKDKEAAADKGLRGSRSLLESDRHEIASISWESEPDISVFDPYYDR